MLSCGRNTRRVHVALAGCRDLTISYSPADEIAKSPSIAITSVTVRLSIPPLAPYVFLVFFFGQAGADARAEVAQFALVTCHGCCSEEADSMDARSKSAA